MSIETYEIEEVANNVDDSAEVRELVEKLNLTGQQKLATGDGKQFPYRKITTEETAVYERILPKKTAAKDYASGCIPLRALQVMAHADSLRFFDSFEIWHPEDVRKDPLLIGLKQDGRYEWQKDRFILARWGEVLESFDVLRKRAAEIAREALKSQAVKAKMAAELALAQIDTWPESKLLTETLSF